MRKLAIGTKTPAAPTRRSPKPRPTSSRPSPPIPTPAPSPSSQSSPTPHAAGWPAFWNCIQHYLRHERYSPGGDGDLIEYPAGHELDNSQASAALDLQLATSLDGDTKAHFIATGDKFTGKGFLKLAELKDKFGRTGLLDVARDLFVMLKKTDLQASLTPTLYKKDLCEQFLCFAEGGIKLPGPVQLMIMLRSPLHSEYEPIREQYREGQPGCNLLTDKLNAVTKWCDRYNGEFEPSSGHQNKHHHLKTYYVRYGTHCTPACNVP